MYFERFVQLIKRTPNLRKTNDKRPFTLRRCALKLDCLHLKRDVYRTGRDGVLSKEIVTEQKTERGQSSNYEHR